MLEGFFPNPFVSLAGKPRKPQPADVAVRHRAKSIVGRSHARGAHLPRPAHAAWCPDLQVRTYALHAVHDGVAGLAAAWKRNYDFAILDIMLPSMDGFEILRQLRWDSELPVLMLTSHGEFRFGLLLVSPPPGESGLILLKFEPELFSPYPFHDSLHFRIHYVLFARDSSGCTMQRSKTSITNSSVTSTVIAGLCGGNGASDACCRGARR